MPRCERCNRSAASVNEPVSTTVKNDSSCAISIERTASPNAHRILPTSHKACFTLEWSGSGADQSLHFVDRGQGVALRLVAAVEHGRQRLNRVGSLEITAAQQSVRRIGRSAALVPDGAQRLQHEAATDPMDPLFPTEVELVQRVADLAGAIKRGRSFVALR